MVGARAPVAACRLFRAQPAQIAAGNAAVSPAAIFLCWACLRGPVRADSSCGLQQLLWHVYLLRGRLRQAGMVLQPQGVCEAL